MKINSVLKTCAAAAVLSVAMAAAVFAANPVNVTINGKSLESDTPAQIVDGRTMVPLRAIFEALGAEIEWSAKDKTVTAEKDGTVIKMTIGAPSFDKNGTEVELDTPAMVIDSRTMVPARAVSESLGCDVKWDAETKTVIISVPENADKATETTTAEESSEENTELDIPEWIGAFSQLKRPAPVSQKLAGDEAMYNVHDSARYSFEQSYLPSVVYGNKDKALSAIKDTKSFEEYVRTIWEKNANGTVLYYLAEVDENTYTISSEDDLYKLLDEFTEKTELGFDKNIAVQTAETDNGYIGVIAVANDYTDVCCAYIAVKYDKDIGFRIYTLEYEPFMDGYLVCYITDDGRGNYGVGIDEESAATAEKFLTAIYDIESQND